MHPDTVQNQGLTVQMPGSSRSPFIEEAMQELILPSKASLTVMRALETDHPGHQRREVFDLRDSVQCCYQCG